MLVLLTIHCIQGYRKRKLSMIRCKIRDICAERWNAGCDSCNTVRTLCGRRRGQSILLAFGTALVFPLNK